MELTNPSYFLVLALLVLAYWPLPQRGRVYLLLAGSYALYALWDLRYLAVLVGSTALDFLLAAGIERTSIRHATSFACRSATNSVQAWLEWPRVRTRGVSVIGLGVV